MIIVTAFINLVKQTFWQISILFVVKAHCNTNVRIKKYIYHYTREICSLREHPRRINQPLGSQMCRKPPWTPAGIVAMLTGTKNAWGGSPKTRYWPASEERPWIILNFLFIDASLGFVFATSTFFDQLRSLSTLCLFFIIGSQEKQASSTEWAY